mgnify:CR=1 FL=1
MWFVKSKRAQNQSDYESWNEGGVAPTLNAMDNNGEAFATVLIIDGTRVNDVRVYEDGIVPTVISRYGTGGGNVPMVFSIDNANETEKQTVAYSISEHSKNNTFSVVETETALTLKTLRPSANSQHAQLFVAEPSTVRRLTPMECERLQGFPDNWTDGQADSNRYKQMGNAVAVPVVEWIISRMVGEDETN